MNPFQRAQNLLDKNLAVQFGIPGVLVVNGIHHPIDALFSTPEDLSRARVQSRANDHRIGKVQTSKSSYQLEILNDQIIGLCIVAGVLVHINNAIYKITKPERPGANTTLFSMTDTGDKL